MFGRNDDDNSQPAEPVDQNWQHPGQPIEPTDTSPPVPAPTITPISDDRSAIIEPETEHPNIPDVPDLPKAEEPKPEPKSELKVDKEDLVDVSSNDLIEIKQEALGQLTPLMSHLDQSPEEKFRTIMMMIQASDDQTQIKTAYEAAKEIKDEKVRAQALLDIVNEINYFTNQQNN